MNLDVTTTGVIRTTNSVVVNTSAVVTAIPHAEVSTSAVVSVTVLKGPPVSEIPVYTGARFPSEIRVAVELDAPYWVQGEFHNFSTPGVPSVAFAQQWVNGGIAVAGGSALIRRYKAWVEDEDGNFAWRALPLFDWFKCKESYRWIPFDKAQPFAIEVDFTFPESDPIYSVPIIFPGMTNRLGDLQDPLQIIQRGYAVNHATGLDTIASNGRLFFISNGVEVLDMANDQAQHTIRLEWNPSIANILTIKLDGGTIHTSNNAARPERPFFGWSWDVLHEYGDVETPIQPVEADGNPVTVLAISRIESLELGSEGFEVPYDPAFTIPNQGATSLETALPGEIFEMDGSRWAILPDSYIESITGETGRDVQISKAALTFMPIPDADLSTHTWNKRKILIDSRQIAWNGDTTSWKRVIAGRIKKFQSARSNSNLSASLEINSLPEDSLRVVAARSWRGSDTEEIPGVNVGYTIQMVLEDLCDVAEQMSGNNIERLIWDMDLLVSDIGTLGQPLLNVFSEIIDKIAYQYFPTYETSGVDRYGKLNVWAWELGTGTPDYTLTEHQVEELQVSEDSEEGPSQVNLRQNMTEEEEDTFVNTFLMPTPGVFPTVPMPIDNPVLSDSLAFSNLLSASGLQVLHGENNDTILGGISAHRWRMLQANRRSAVATLMCQDYVKPGDEISMPFDPSLAGETWIVNHIKWTYERATFTSQVSLVTSMWEQAVRRGF